MSPSTWRSAVRAGLWIAVALLLPGGPAGAFVPKNAATVVVREEGGGPVAGAEIWVDETRAGTADAAGRYVLTLPRTGTATVTAVADGQGGSVTVTATDRGRTLAIEIKGDGTTREALARLEQAPEGLLRGPAGQTLRILMSRPSGAPLGLMAVEVLRISAAVPGAAEPEEYGADLSARAVINTDGSVSLTPDAALQARLAALADRVLTLEIVGRGPGPFVYEGSVRFMRAPFRLRGRLVPPPSRPGLGVADITVAATVLGTDLRVERRTDAAGVFIFEALPGTLLDLAATTADPQGLGYAAGEQIALRGDADATLVLLGAVDVANGVRGATVTPAAPAVVPQSAPAPPPPRARSAAALVPPVAALPTATSDPRCTAAEVTASVTSGPREQPVSATRTLTLPQGTRSLTLTYTVASREYPEYVRTQSPYNDVWQVQVATLAAPAAVNIIRRVNAQLTAAPVWRPDGTTGPVTQTIDVSAATQAGPAAITLRLSATNIGDALFPTTVTARLTAEAVDGALTVSLAEDGFATPGVVSLPVNPPPGDGAAPGPRRNEFGRHLRLATAGVRVQDLSRIRVFLEPVDAPAPAVAVVDTQTTPAALRREGDMAALVQVTASGDMPNYPVGIDGAGLFRRFQYRVEADLPGPDGLVCPIVRRSGPLIPLFRAPPTPDQRRYGPRRNAGRERGGDDWAARATHTWLAAPAGAAPAIVFNDISGEHGRDIGHRSHRQGLHVDTLHFGEYPNVQTGGENLRLLRNDVLAALDGNAAARARAATWIEAQRAGIRSLLADGRVRSLIVGNGRANGTLPDGWLRGLVTTGRLTAGGRTLDIGGSLAPDNRLSFRGDHDDHNHVDIRDDG